jgi:hypothetical protein
MATTTFDGNTTGLSWLGQWATGTVSSEAYKNRLGSSSELHSKWTGTQLEIRVWGTSSYKFLVSIDGGAFDEYTTSAGYAWYTVATGLSEGEHTVVVRAFTTTGFLYISTVSTLRVTGDAPAVGYRTGYGPILDIDSSYFVKTANPITTTSGGYSNGKIAYWSHSWNGTYNNGGVRFVADTTDIWAWIYAYGGGAAPGTSWGLVQDGTLLGVTTSSNFNGYELIHLGSGLSGSHTYEVLNTHSRTNGTQWGYIVQIMAGGGTGIVASTPAARPLMAFFGDSITLEHDGTVNSTFGRCFLTSQELGHECLKVAKNGETWTWAKTTYDRVTGGAKKPKVVWVCFGANEVVNNMNMDTMQADAESTLNSLMTDLDSDALVFVEGVMPSTFTGMSLRRDTANTRIAAAVAAVNNSRCVFVSTDGWFDPATGTVDQIHPNPTGYTLISEQEVSTYQASVVPNAPSNVSATDGTYTDKILVTWVCPDGATTCKVYRNTSDDSGSATLIATLEDVVSFEDHVTLEDNPPSVGTIYYYWVKAANDTGESDFSESDSGYIAETEQSSVAPSGFPASRRIISSGRVF